MKSKLFAITLLVTSTAIVYGQRPVMELTFTAVNDNVQVQMDSIKVMNRSQGGDTVLYWPDTVLSINYVGMSEISDEKNIFQVFQNYPNPVEDQTTVSIYVPEKDRVTVTVTDILGRMIVHSSRELDKGKHSFGFTPGGGNLYFFIAMWQGQRSSIKILHTGADIGHAATLEYSGSENFFPEFKLIEGIQEFSFNPGDELLCIGYTDTLQSGMLDSPEESAIYTFQFATNIPCPGTPTVEYEGQVYNTIQIFSQCWLKESLNVGTMIPGLRDMTDNDTIEKYCYNDEPDSCIKYGGLYQWDEMMHYTNQQGVQGICPAGWHLPTDEEWKVLEGAVDSQYGIGDPEWDLGWGFQGYDVGANLKATSGWAGNGNGTDLFGFSGLPAGERSNNGSFTLIRTEGYYMSSAEYDNLEAIGRNLYVNSPAVYWYYNYKVHGFSVRCLRDD